MKFVIDLETTIFTEIIFIQGMQQKVFKVGHYQFLESEVIGMGSTGTVFKG